LTHKPPGNGKAEDPEKKLIKGNLNQDIDIKEIVCSPVRLSYNERSWSDRQDADKIN
jgi:hypothetical protein